MSTKRLGSGRRERAREYLESRARPLDRERHRMTLGGRSPEPYLKALAAFRNPDGGFGRSLEPDLRTPSSSAIVTSVALQHLRRARARVDHPLVEGALEYLVETMDRESLAWAVTSPDTEEFPHAFWWKGKASPSEGLLNPRVELLGHLLHYPDRVPADLLAALTESTVAHLLVQEDALEMHVFLCLQRLLETPELPARVRKPLQDKLEAAAACIIVTDPEGWQGYGMPPTAAITRPDSSLYPRFEAAVQAHLDHVVETCEEDGTWPVPWSWEAADPEAWAEAEREWRGVLVVDRLELLAAFDRLE